ISGPLPQVVTNFRDANHDLARLLDGDLSNVDIAAIHATTYTSAYALAKLQQVLVRLAQRLEDLLFASVKDERETLTTQGDDDMQVTRELEKLGAAKPQ